MSKTTIAEPMTTKTGVRPEWGEARRIVVKIGSALLADRETGDLKAEWLEFADRRHRQPAKRRPRSRPRLLRCHRARPPRAEAARGPLELEESQAAAAVGQISAGACLSGAGRPRGLTAAQILLTLGDTEERRRYLNARHTIETLLALKAIPVVNENDTVATTEIRYGDNDRLSARVASMMSADCLVLLSDIDGLYTAPPGSRPDAQRLDVVTEITPEIEAMAGDAGTELSKGGMKTKIEAAKIALGAGTTWSSPRARCCIRCAPSPRAQPAPGSWRRPIR